MPLTLRTNGSGSSNLVGAAWWNDYYNLLTGVMADQEVTIHSDLILKGIGADPAAAMIAALAASSSGLGVGVYKYVVTFDNGNGESKQSPTTTITTTTGNQNVTLSSIPLGPTGTQSRNIYRTLVGGSNLYFDHQIPDNTTTTYLDVATDASLTTTQIPPAHSTLGGALFVKDYTGVTQLTISNDGTIISNASPNSVTINGTTSGTLTAYMDLGNGLKRVALWWNNFRNGATANTLILPTPFSIGAHIDSGNGIGFNVNLAGGSNITFMQQTGFQSESSTTRVDQWVMDDIAQPFDRIVTTTANATAHTGWTILTGA